MSQSHMPSDIAATCTRASLDATFATSAACTAMATHALQTWAHTLSLVLPAPAEPSRSWYRKPEWASSAVGPALAGFTGTPQPFTAAAFTNAWIGMMSFQGSPSAWPMAFIMLAAGMPKSVAFPAAEANVAVIRMADETATAMRAHAGIGRGPHTLTPREVPAPIAPFAAWPWFGAPN